MLVLRYYFKRRLGFANGVLFSGIGAGVLIFTPLVEWLCNQYGWRGALVVHAAINSNIIAFGALYRPSGLEKQMLKARESTSSRPNPTHTEEHTRSSWRFCKTIDESMSLSSLLKNRLFVAFSVTSIFIYWGYMSSTLFLFPKLVHDLSFSTKTASLVMTAFGISSSLAIFFHGFLLDYKVISVTNLNLLAIFVCGINPVVNPLVNSTAGQFILSVLLGAGGGVMAALVPPIIRQYVPMENVSNAIGLFYFMTVIGMLMGTEFMGKLS